MRLNRPINVVFATASFIAFACSSDPKDGDEKGEGKETGTSSSSSTDSEQGSGSGLDIGDTDTDTETTTGEVPDNCGDGVLDKDEACDDGNRSDHDGCQGNCLRVDPGYVCKPNEDGNDGQECIPIARCGDGLVSFPEQCDDENRKDGDGCDQRCRLELGYQCSGEPSSCSATECGDGKVQGTEMCEPSVDKGCTSQCVLAPDCSGDGPCTSACGDGFVLDEECDDGNTLSGDGCDENCKIETGYTCSLQEFECEVSEHTGECIIRVPVTYRDFDSTHSDFESECGGLEATEGLVEAQLSKKKPVATGTAMCTTNFDDWYNDTDESTTLASELVLYDDGMGNFKNRFGADGTQWVTKLGWNDGVDCSVAPHCGPFDGSPFFFPIDGIEGARGDGASIAEVTTTSYGMDGTLYTEEALTGSGPKHNFSFTSEVAYWFPYDANTEATLRFTGDDDVWVFINGRLALDLGGLHPAISGEVTVSGSEDSFVGGTAEKHGMEQGKLYEIKIFHAERHTTGSTFKLTLSGFNPGRSSCGGECGNGTVEFGEECDDGVDNRDEYNHCGTDCRLGDFCGDGKVDDEETCDDAIDSTCSGCRNILIR